MGFYARCLSLFLLIVGCTLNRREVDRDLDFGIEVVEGEDGGQRQPEVAQSLLIYTAHRGVSTPWFTPLGPDGPREPIQLAPRSGGGYGLGEGEIAYPELTPDGRYVVVGFYPLNTPSSWITSKAILFALPTEGSGEPILLARTQELRSSERAYSGGWMAYVDGGDKLFVTQLDGSTAEMPLLIAQVDEDRDIEKPKWLPGERRVAFHVRSRVNSATQLFTAAADGSQINAPTQIEGVRFLAEVLSTGTLVALNQADQLVAILPGSNGPGVPLTPEGPIGGYVGASVDGSTVVATLRETWREERRLVSVSVDGSLVESPRLLIEAAHLNAIISRDGQAVAWTHQGSDQRWAVSVARVEGPGGPEARVSEWSRERLHVTAFDQEANALVGSRVDGSVLRFPADTGAEPRTPEVLAQIDELVNHSIPWPTLSLDGQYLLYAAHTPAGFRTWTQPLTGGEPKEMEGPWYMDSLTPYGVIHQEYVSEAAGFVVSLEGDSSPVQLTAWHQSPLINPRLLEDPEGRPMLAYASLLPQPGWYTAQVSLEGQGSEHLVMPLEPPADHWEPEPPLFAAGRFVRLRDRQIESFSLDGSQADQPLILGRDASSLIVDPDHARAIFVVEGVGVVSISVEGGERSLLFATSGAVLALFVLPGGDRVVVVVNEEGEQRMYAVGEERAPQLIASELPGWFLGAAPTATGEYLLALYSIEATAVPHPDLLLLSDARPGPDNLSPGQPLAPPRYLPLGLSAWFDLGASHHPALGPYPSTPDGRYVLLLGPEGLYRARSDGSEATQPTWLGPATEVIGEVYSPDETQVLLTFEQKLVIQDLVEPLPMQTLTTPVEGMISDGVWSADGQRILFRVQEPISQSGGALYIVDIDAQEVSPKRLSEETFPVTRLFGLIPGGDRALVESIAGGDHSLYAVESVAEGLPVALTPVDDAAETFVGFMEILR